MNIGICQLAKRKRNENGRETMKNLSVVEDGCFENYHFNIN